MPAGGWGGDPGRDCSGGKREDQPRVRGTFVALKGVVRRERVGGDAEPGAKGRLWAAQGGQGGCGEALACSMRRQSWETGCMAKAPAVRRGGGEVHRGVFNLTQNKKNF